MALSKVKVERLDQTGRRDAEALAGQLSKITRTRPAELKLQGVMGGIDRKFLQGELAELRHSIIRRMMSTRGGHP